MTTAPMTIATCNVDGFSDEDGEPVIGWEGTPGHAMVAALDPVYDAELGGLFIYATDEERAMLQLGCPFAQAVARSMSRREDSTGWRAIGDLLHFDALTSEQRAEFCMVRLGQDMRRERAAA